MRNYWPMVYCLVLAASLSCQQKEEQAKTLTPSEVIERAIAYHDPHGNLYKKALHFTINHSSADTLMGQSNIVMDYQEGSFYQKMNYAKDSAVIERYILGDSSAGLLNGSVVFTEAEGKKHSIDSAGIQYIGNYYRYLLRLPYSLTDNQVKLADSVLHKPFKGMDCYWVAINYDSSIQREKWYYFFDPTTFRLLGGMYYYTDPKSDGDYALFEGEIVANDIRFSQKQAWKRYHNDEFFGRDEIVAVEVVD